MVLSNKEKQKRWREKQKAIKAGLIEPETKPEPVDMSFLLEGFSEWIRAGANKVELVEMIEDEISNLTLGHLLKETIPGEQVFCQNTISMAHAAMRDLASLLSRFKSEKITAEIARIEAEELDVPELRQRAIEKIVQLKNLHDRYQRKTRWETATYYTYEEQPSQQAHAKQHGLLIDWMEFED